MRVKGISRGSKNKNGSSGNTQVYRLPCKTQVATGFCPYRQRCQFLHDHRLAGSVSSKLRMDKSSHRVSTEEDSFFWPMQPSFSSTNTNTKQEYNIRRNVHEQDPMIQSMWSHFCEFTSASELPHRAANHTTAAPTNTSTSSPSAVDRRLGRLTPRSAPPSVSPTRRLDVLRRLSESEDCESPAPSPVPTPMPLPKPLSQFMSPGMGMEMPLPLPLQLPLSQDSPVFVPSDTCMVVDGQTSLCCTEDDAAMDMHGSLSSSLTSFTSLSVSVSSGADEDVRWLPYPSPGSARPTTPLGVCDLYSDDLDSDGGSNSSFSLLSTSRC